MTGSDDPKSAGPFTVPDDFLRQEIAAETTAVTMPDDTGFRVGDQRQPKYVPANHPNLSFARMPRPDHGATVQVSPTTDDVKPEPTSSGLVVEIGASPAAPKKRPSARNQKPNNQVPKWVVICTVAAGLTIIAAMYYVVTVNPHEHQPEDQTAVVEDVGGVQVRPGLRAPAPKATPTDGAAGAPTAKDASRTP